MSEAGGDPLLAIEELTKAFGGVHAVDGLDLTLDAGAMLCVIGPNGCGKTTLFNLISGYLRGDAGRVRFGGRDVSRLPMYRRAALGIGRKFQVPSVFPSLSVAENLRAAMAVPHRSGDRPEVGEAMAAVGLDPALAHREAGHLSHGEKQWLELGMVLAAGPRLLLLDEPTAGMTRGETLETARLVRAVHADRGLTTILIEHDMHFVAALECPVAVMLEGRVVARGTYDEVRALDVVRAAYLGIGHG